MLRSITLPFDRLSFSVCPCDSSVILIEEVFFEPLLWARHCSGHLGHGSVRKAGNDPCLYGGHISAEGENIKQQT